jgi:hypothetical protein
MYPAGRGLVSLVCNRCGGFLLGEGELRLLDYTYGGRHSRVSQRGVSQYCNRTPAAWWPASGPPCSRARVAGRPAGLLLGVAVVGAPTDAGLDKVVDCAIEHG